MKNQEKYYFECINCGKTYSQNEVTYLCPECASENDSNTPPQGVLKTKYFYKKIRATYKRNKLFDKIREKGYIDLLPIQSIRNLSFLKVGKTPLYKFQEKDYSLLLKDDSQNPTFSFKDRASNLVSAIAKEKIIDTIVTASTGNAGSSLAGICASQKQKAVVFVPAKAPVAKLTQIMMYGAKIIPVEGTYDDAFELSLQATEKFGWYNRNTAFNPFTIEGKKTVSYELFRQLNWDIPDRIFVPVGDGVIISSVYKGFEDLLMLKLIDKMPTIVSVQSENSDNIIRNYTQNKFVSKKSDTVADSIAVDIPRNFWMAKHFLETYNGESISVSDEMILNAEKQLSENYGIFSEPAASAAFAGFQQYLSLHKINSGSDNIVLLTGSGLKDLKSIQKFTEMPEPIKSLSDIR